MTSALTPAPLRSQVQRLKLRARGPMKEQRRLREVEAALRSEDLEPPCWPRGAVLVVQALNMQLSATPSVGAPVALTRALREQLARVASSASRPEGGRLPAGAPAIVFEDLAEALAVFALSAVEGRAAREWWWPRVLGDGLQSWIAVFCRHSAQAPRAVSALRGSGALAVVVRALSGDEAGELLDSLARAYALPLVRSALQAASASKLGSERAGSAEPPGVSEAARRAEESTAHEQELVSVSRGAVHTALAPTARAWVATCLGLVHEPWRVRSPRFSEAITHNLTSAPIGGGHSELGTNRSSTRSIERAPRASASPPNDFAPPDGAVALVPPTLPTSPSRGGRMDPRERRTRSTDPFGLGRAPTDIRAEPVREERLDSGLAPRESLRTAFGGVFYLVNVALALELYPDFSEPSRAGLELPFWNFIARVASGLLEAELRSALYDDPIWQWLARMAGPCDATGEWDERVGTELDRIERRLALANVPNGFLEQSAVVLRESERVEVHFTLASHPLAVRLAGLDRDPAWLPSAGIELRFVYE